MWHAAQNVLAVWTVVAALAFVYTDEMSWPVKILVCGAFVGLGLLGAVHAVRWALH